MWPKNILFKRLIRSNISRYARAGGFSKYTNAKLFNIKM